MVSLAGDSRNCADPPICKRAAETRSVVDARARRTKIQTTTSGDITENPPKCATRENDLANSTASRGLRPAVNHDWELHD